MIQQSHPCALIQKDETSNLKRYVHSVHSNTVYHSQDGGNNLNDQQQNG